jgi:hypothetical protein
MSANFPVMPEVVFPDRKAIVCALSTCHQHLQKKKPQRLIIFQDIPKILHTQHSHLSVFGSMYRIRHRFAGKKTHFTEYLSCLNVGDL